MIAKIIEPTNHIPSNFPTITDIRQHWYIWRKENPHKTVAQFQVKDCEDCESVGILFFKVIIEDAFPYQYAVKCGKCQNWRMHWGQNIPTTILTRDEIIARGWQILRQVKDPIQTPQEPINKLTDGMLKDIPKTSKTYEGPRQEEFTDTVPF